MTKTTEELKREMYRELEHLKRPMVEIARKAVMIGFEESFEKYLEALRQKAASLSASLTEVQKYGAILSDVYAHQQQLTHAACQSERESWGEIHDLKAKVRELQTQNDDGCRVLTQLQEQLAASKRNEHNSEVAYKAAIEKQEELRAELAEAGNADHLRQRIAFLTSEAHARAGERDDFRNKLQAFEFANQSAGEFLIESQELVKQYRETNKRQRLSIGQLKNERDNAVHTLKVKESKLQTANARIDALLNQIKNK